MNEKISFPDLVALLALKMNVTKKDAEAFLKEFFTISTEVISSGEALKINELGLFKPIWVEPRASVNVQTGEPVEIPGHYKLSFIPDKTLREAVNAPFSSFSVEILNDHVSTEEMMAVGSDEPVDTQEVETREETVDLPEEEPLREEIDDIPVSDDVTTEDTLTEEVEAAAIEPIIDTEPTPEPVQEPIADNDSVETLSQEVQPEQGESQSADEPTPELQNTTPADKPVADKSETLSAEEDNFYQDYLQKSASRRAFWWGALSAFGLFVVICAAVWFFLLREDGMKIGEYTLSLTNKEVLTTQPAANNTEEPVVLSEQQDTTSIMPAIEPDTVVTEPKIPTESSEPKLQKSEPANKAVVETIRSGVFLTTLARKHFGHKAFWVYIYEENKGVIKNPNQVPIGTRLVIPDAAKYGIDVNNESSVAKAKALAAKIQSQYE